MSRAGDDDDVSKKRKQMEYTTPECFSTRRKTARGSIGKLFYSLIGQATSREVYEQNKTQLIDLCSHCSFFNDTTMHFHLEPDYCNLNFFHSSKEQKTQINQFCLDELIEILGLLPLGALCDLLVCSSPDLQSSFDKVQSQLSHFNYGFIRSPLVCLESWVRFFEPFRSQTEEKQQHGSLLMRWLNQLSDPRFLFRSSLSTDLLPNHQLFDLLGLVFCLHAILGLKFALEDDLLQAHQKLLLSEACGPGIDHHRHLFVRFACFSSGFFSLIIRSLGFHSTSSFEAQFPILFNEMARVCFSSAHNLQPSLSCSSSLWESLLFLHNYVVEQVDEKFDPSSLHAAQFSVVIFDILNSFSGTEGRTLFSDFLDRAIIFFTKVRNNLFDRHLMKPHHHLPEEKLLRVLEQIHHCQWPKGPKVYHKFLSLFVLVFLPLPPDPKKVRNHPFVMPFRLATQLDFFRGRRGLISSIDAIPRSPESLNLISVIVRKFRCFPFAPPENIQEVQLLASRLFPFPSISIPFALPKKPTFFQWLAYVLDPLKFLQEDAPSSSFQNDLLFSRFREGLDCYNQIIFLSVPEKK